MDNENTDCSAKGSSSVLCKPSFLSNQEWCLLVKAFRLSPRETEISNLILAGMSERGIADTLAISMHTVHSHLERLYRKLHVHTRCELVMVFFKTYVQARDERGSERLDGYSPEYQSE